MPVITIMAPHSGLFQKFQTQLRLKIPNPIKKALVLQKQPWNDGVDGHAPVGNLHEHPGVLDAVQVRRHRCPALTLGDVDETRSARILNQGKIDSVIP